jgi:hypothetical protein
MTQREVDRVFTVIVTSKICGSSSAHDTISTEEE